MPGVCARSWTAAVGRPPLQKNAAILPSFSAPADSDDAEPLPGDVAIGIEPGRAQHPRRR